MHREIRKDHVRSELAQRSNEFFFAIDNAMADAQARTLDLSDLELRIRGHILDEQHAEGRHGLGCGFHCGTRLKTNRVRRRAGCLRRAGPAIAFSTRTLWPDQPL